MPTRRLGHIEQIDRRILETERRSRREPGALRERHLLVTHAHSILERGLDPATVDLGLRARKTGEVGGLCNHDERLRAWRLRPGDGLRCTVQRRAAATEGNLHPGQGQAPGGTRVEEKGSGQIAAGGKVGALRGEDRSHCPVEHCPVLAVGQPCRLELVLDDLAFSPHLHEHGRVELVRQSEGPSGFRQARLWVVRGQGERLPGKSFGGFDRRGIDSRGGRSRTREQRQRRRRRHHRRHKECEERTHACSPFRVRAEPRTR